MAGNLLYYGNNLPVLREHIDDDSVDLVYLDPPFKSDQDYNVLFAAQDGTRSPAQIKAFEDTWRWDQAAAAEFHEAVEAGGRVAEALLGFEKLLGHSDMLAYVAMMSLRLKELRRVLKPTGSIYLHCDPAASHYLKVLMDSVFGPLMFRNEIIWRRTGAHSSAKRYGPIHDVILFYTKSATFKWRRPKRPYMRGHVEEYFIRDANGYRTDYYGNVLTGSGTRNGESGKPWRGVDPTLKGRHWAVPGTLIADLDEDVSGLTQHQKLDRLYELGHIKIVEGQAWPMYERYLKPGDGTPLPDIWAYQPYTEGTVFGTNEGIDEEVRWLASRDAERLGYPTQKPEALLDRIIQASSDEGDTVLDPFCGCGTTIASAQRLKRSWIGIDITHLAISLIKSRLRYAYGEDAKYEVKGEPTSADGAAQLAKDDPYQFQFWALGLVGARGEEKKGADKGIDGRLYFHEGPQTKTRQIIFSVKSGKLKAEHVRDLVGVIAREKAEIGVLISLAPPTAKMREEAAGAGFYQSPWGKHPRLQLLTVAELLDGRKVDSPQTAGTNVTFKVAKKAKQVTPAAAFDHLEVSPAELAKAVELVRAGKKSLRKKGSKKKSSGKNVDAEDLFD